ncbi:hypothetical protein [Marinirhabdus gelatinilytica]|uniref:Uncharacterized protein n=1 Tax=Marinirhabdus gelatinilytica TaxID=1703343 RepID=A0A370QC83_9FLAO|nr:hypothetical protein [Marinirhabdus gelatinilytica]RDK85600.1 hypothetical protein C8D94_103427 [Marinirhabdus gelatinilytica]
MAYEFFLDALHTLPLHSKNMFGVTAYYLEDYLLFALNTNKKYPNDIGIWVATPLETQEELTKLLDEWRYLQRIPTKKYVLLPAESDTFEADARTITELILNRSTLIGTLPKKKSSQRKSD